MIGYLQSASAFNAAWRHIQESFTDETLGDLAEIRGYPLSSPLLGYIRDSREVVWCSQETIDGLKSLDLPSDLGIWGIDKNGNEYSVLSERFVTPVRDFMGNVLALIGYYPDSRKYMTTRSPYFKKSVLFMGLDQLQYNPRLTVIVEGVFDYLSLRSIGITALSTMGIGVSSDKQALYPLMGKIVGIPDMDKQGQKVLMYDNWKLPEGSRYLRWKDTQIALPDGSSYSVKDVDALLKFMRPDDMRDIFNRDFSGRIQTL